MAIRNKFSNELSFEDIDAFLLTTPFILQFWQTQHGSPKVD